MTEKHLLFAVLAFESDLIDLAQLTAACRAWVADKSKPIADLLVERGWITAEDRGFVEKQLERKLAKHQHDPRVTLNSVVRGDVCDAIKQVEDADIQQSLSSWPSSGTVLIETIGETLGEPEQPKSRYTWVSEVGKGGLGKVWLARDNDLAREVALKEVKPGSASTEAVRRLIKEAQITGQLQHPNIVPVYEVNRGGRPFYTMKFVKGETLLQAIQQHHQRRREWRKDLLSDQRLMSVFLNVCDAIAYAHSRGIIHRDLKPDNIVLGDYGEAIVLDWGLARRVDATDEDTFPVELTEDACTDATQAGQKLGTPAYMSPEQASGRVDLIDHRTDIYGLGAILFQILTGEPPHRTVADAASVGLEKTSWLPALLNSIVTGETPHACDYGVLLPDELDGICAKAMNKSRDERFQSAKDLKSALLEFQVHKESIDLTATATRQLEHAKKSERYQDYNRALFGFEEALRQWPDNTEAIAGVEQTLIAHGQTAIKHGDIDPRMGLLPTNGDIFTEVQKKLAQAYEELERRAVRMKILKVTGLALLVGFAGLSAIAAKGQFDLAATEKKRIAAEYNEAAAKIAKVDAEKAAEKAKEAQKQADAQRVTAVIQKEEAVIQKEEAVELALVSEGEKKIAEMEKQKAKAETIIAQSATMKAEVARADADKAKTIAALAALVAKKEAADSKKEAAEANEKSNYLLGLLEAHRFVLEDRYPDALKKMMQLKRDYPDRCKAEWDQLWKKVAPPP